MPVKKDASGRRFVELDFELPGSPEDVWQAIATGPGISAWFLPAEVEEREGGAVAFHIGPGIDTSGHVTAWQPPHRFAYEETDWDEGAPPLASEFVIEAQAGGTCKVRLVHSLFAEEDDWDDQLEGMASGWPPFFAVLRTYLRHFRGRPCATLRLMGGYAGPQAEAWNELLRKLALAGAAAGERRETGAGAPPLAGTVESLQEKSLHREMMLRLDAPTAGIALIGQFTWDGKVQIAISLYLYGDEATTAAAAAEPVWRNWMAAHFPPPEATAEESSGKE